MTAVTTYDIGKTAITNVSDQVRSLIDAATSKATRRAYRGNLARFMSWAGINSLPVKSELVAAYIAYLVDCGKSSSTINQAVCAIAEAHKRMQLESPTEHHAVRLVMRGVRRKIGTAPARKTAMTIDILRTVITSIDRDTLAGKRDAALLLIGFAGAFRRSELSALNVNDISRQTARNGRDHVVINVRRSKTDQDGQGAIKAIPAGKGTMCPVTALRDYLSAAGITDGAIFRRVTKGNTLIDDRLSGKAIAAIIKRCAKRAGLSDTLDFSGHSLRSGFVTSAINAGANERQIANQTGHRSVVVLRGYIQRSDAINDNAVTTLF